MLNKLPIVFMAFLCTSITFAEDLAGQIAKAEAGDFEAMCGIGLAYLSDDDPSNNSDGIKWLEMSHAGGNIQACYNLGAQFQDGASIQADANKAIMYLNIAAELGEVRAMNRLAGIYYMGKIVPQNDVLAIKWALCASGLGSQTAKDNLSRMENQVGQREKMLGANAALAWGRARMKNAQQDDSEGSP